MNTRHFFESYFQKAKVNCFLIIDGVGKILDVSPSFTRNFLYSAEEIKGQPMSILYTERDRKKKLPEKELDTVKNEGQARDENYIVDKNGNAIWCTGESVLVETDNGEPYIVKDIINLETKKQNFRFLKNADELLESVVTSSEEQDIPVIVLNGSMRIRI